VVGMPLNTPFTKDAAEAHYGRIVHPTITDVVRMINEFYREQTSIDPSVQWKDIRLWRMDLKGPSEHFARSARRCTSLQQAGPAHTPSSHTPKRPG
jgi:hypothetical protein